MVGTMTLYNLILYAIQGATNFDKLPLDNNDWLEIIDFATVWNKTHGDVNLEDLILLEVPKEHDHGKKENK